MLEKKWQRAKEKELYLFSAIRLVLIATREKSIHSRAS
jgi:hypothetical protein